MLWILEVIAVMTSILAATMFVCMIDSMIVYWFDSRKNNINIKIGG